MLVIVGPSASGKSELASALISQYHFEKVITTTTRNPRVGEVNHIDYHFLTKEEFSKELENNYFIEHTFYNNNYYGTAKKDLQDHKIIILDPNGLNNLLLKNIQTFVVYLQAKPSIRQERMIGRGDSSEEIRKRLLNDKNWFSKRTINQINLAINNNRDFKFINKLAQLVNNKYQRFLKKKNN